MAPKDTICLCFYKDAREGPVRTVQRPPGPLVADDAGRDTAEDTLVFPWKEQPLNEIKGIARVKFHPGKVDEWKRLTEQAMEVVRTKDSGTLQYEIFFNEDESEAIVFERYRDADAAIEHFSNISYLMAPIMATASVTGEVLGTPNSKMKEQLGKGEPKLFTPWMAM
jgi:quinol monooxygenase YgiN